MEHDRAVESHAVERYLLREMPPEERDAFEEHYFSCAECCEEMRAAARFRANAREVLENQGDLVLAETRPSRWLAWLRPQFAAPALAAVALAMVVGYQNTVTIPALVAPQSMSAPMILDGPVRAALPQVTAGQPLTFQMALNPPPEGARVLAKLATESGKVLSHKELAAPGLNQPFSVYFPGEFHAGRYAVIVLDVPSGRELARDPFEITPKENKPNEH